MAYCTILWKVLQHATRLYKVVQSMVSAMETDERYYNARQACRILDCYPEEYRRLCSILSIIPQSYTELCKVVQDCTKLPSAPWDKRAKYITGSELAQLQELRGRVPDGQDQAAVAAEVERMRREIASLRAEVARLKAPQQERLHFVASEPVAPAVVRTNRPPLPPGWVALDGFCRRHQLYPSTIDKAIATGRLPKPHRGEWQEGRAIIRNALDEAMQAAILEKYPRDTVL